MFYFMVRYFHWLAKIPGLPLLFDAFLLAWTSMAHRTRLTAMEKLEAEALRLQGIDLRVHRFGGIEFVEAQGKELGHLHGHGLLDVLVGRSLAEKLISNNQVYPHHIFPKSSWVSFQLESYSDVPFALELLMAAHSRILSQSSN